MKTKRSWIALGIVFIIFSSFVLNVSAENPPAPPAPNAPPPQQQDGFNLIFDKLVVFPTERIEAAKDNGYDPKFGKYPPSRYYLEIVFQDRSQWEWGDTLLDQGYLMLHGLMNLFWQALLVWDFMVVLAIEQAFALDIVNLVADEVEVVIRGLAGFNGNGIGSTGIWGNFLTLTIICAGAWIAYKGLYKKDTTSAWSAIISTIFIMMAAFTFFANSSGIMKYLNKLSSGLSQELMEVGLEISVSNDNNADSNSSSFQESAARVNQGKEIKQEKKVYPPQVTSMKSADKVYDMLIKEPYLMLQYGKTSKDPELRITYKGRERVPLLLDSKVGSKQRNEVIALEKNGEPSINLKPNPMFTSVGLFQRLGMLFLLYISHFLIGAVFLGISLAIIVYQFFFVIYALFAPFAFLMALYPAWSGVAMNWVKGFIGYQLKKVLLGVLLTIILTISNMLYSIASPDEAGYAWTLVLQLALVVGVLWKRNELIGIVNSSVGKVSEATDFYNSNNKKQIISYISKGAQRARTVLPRG